MAVTAQFPKVFISYARADGSEYASRLYETLEAGGYNPWRDKRNLDPFRDFTAEIEMAIRQTDYVVVCLTPSIATNSDSFVRREITYAQQKRKPIVPLVFPGGEATIHINNLTWIAFYTGTTPNQQLDFEGGVEQLFQRLHQMPRFVESVVPPDPFREYLESLYDEVVDYLNQRMHSLLTLRGETVQGAVAPSVPDTPAGVLSRSFKPTALPVKKSAHELEPDPPPPRTFANLADAFDHFHWQMLLLGEPGAGKTTALMTFAREAIAHRLEDQTQLLPIFASISKWDAETQPSLIDWLTTILDILSPDALQQQIETSRTLLLLDGLDELGSERTPLESSRKLGIMGNLLGWARFRQKSYDPRVHFLEMLRNGMRRNQVLVSCRTKDYWDIGQEITLKGAITLQPLDDTQVAEYLHGHPDLLVVIQNDPGLRDMARTPLLLSTLAYAYADLSAEAIQLGEFSQTPGELRSEIFRTYVERRYLHETNRSHADLLYSLDKTYRILGHAAAKDVRRQGDEPLKLGDFDLLDTEAFVEQTRRLHLLTGDTKQPRFMHLLLRDYFAYHYCIAWLNRRFSLTRLTELWPQDTPQDIVDTLGNISDERAAAWLVAIAEGKEGRIREVNRYHLYELVGFQISLMVLTLLGQYGLNWVGLINHQSLRPTSGVWAIWGASALLVAIDFFASSFQPRLRLQAACLLPRYKIPEADQGFLSALTSDNRYLRRFAVIEAFEIYDRSWPFSISMRFGDQRQRLTSDDLSVRSLLTILENKQKKFSGLFSYYLSVYDLHGWVLLFGFCLLVQYAVGRLGIIGNDSFRPNPITVGIYAIIICLSYITSKRVRVEAAIRLGGINDPQVIQAMILVLGDRDWQVRKHAATTLLNFGTDPAVVEGLTRVKSDTRQVRPSKRVCDVAKDVLKKIATPEAYAALDNWDRHP